MSIRIGVIGVGEIARNRHLPSIAASGEFTLAGLASHHPAPAVDGMKVHPSHRALLDEVALDAVAICTPPGVRFEVARDALAAGLHVLLEKPPGMGVAEVDALARLAARAGRVLFTTWHSQCNAAVEEARRFLAGKKLAALRIDWNEDFVKYHPDQTWIWESDGFGVFDMGINALSVLSRIVAVPPFVRAAELRIAENHAAPISASLTFGSLDSDGSMEAHMDWGIKGPDQREVRLTTQCGHDVQLLDSAGQLVIDGAVVVDRKREEYPLLYARFADLISRGQSEIDVAPLQMTADAFLMGRRVTVPAFEG